MPLTLTISLGTLEKCVIRCFSRLLTRQTRVGCGRWAHFPGVEEPLRGRRTRVRGAGAAPATDPGILAEVHEKGVRERFVVAIQRLHLGTDLKRRLLHLRCVFWTVWKLLNDLRNT